MNQKHRIVSIDILRGAVMLVMALGHVRHFIHLPALVDEPTNLATTTPILFFTRWISHYCASTFVFLSGISILITGQNRSKAAHSNFLIKRGLWLVIVELFIVTFGLTFNPLYRVIILQVIWATGCSMILLGLLTRTSGTIICIVGCILFFGHNILDYVVLPKEGTMAWIWKFLFTTRGEFITLSTTHSVYLVYAILPWTGIMMLGYSFGALYRKDYNPTRRKRILAIAGVCSILLFLVLRFINKYGDPAPWLPQNRHLFTLMSFINVTKYPVSLQYSCITLGPILLLLSAIENCKGKIADFLSIFGKVPFFYYVLHFFLIHTIITILFFATGHTWYEAMHADSPFLFRPFNFGFNLAMVYAIWPLIILLLYLPCKWFVQYKKSHKYWWLRYL